MSNLHQLDHLAAKLLSTNASIDILVLLTTAPWSLERKNTAIAQGNHPSTHSFLDFIQEEMLDIHKKGIFVMLPYHLIHHHPALCILPLGCVPLRERRPRIITTQFSNVNPTTHRLALKSSMQWGRTLQRVL